MLDPYKLLCRLDGLDPRQWPSGHLTDDRNLRNQVLLHNLKTVQFFLSAMDDDNECLLRRKLVDIVRAIEAERVK